MKKSLILFFLCYVNYGTFAQQKIQHTSTASNTSNNSTFINADGLNNNPNAIIIVEYDAATAKANPHAVGIWYNGSQWAIFNQDRATMPAGLTFNLTWKSADANAYTHKVVNGNTMLDHPSLNNNSSASFFASQVWNPGGVGGVYNNADITVNYNQQLGRWEIKNQNGSPLAEGSAFNILVTDPAAVANSNYNPQNNIDKTALLNKNPTEKIKNIIDKNPVITDATIVLTSLKDANLDFENAFFNWKPAGNAFSNKAINGNPVLSDRVLTGMKYEAGGIGGDYWKGMVYPIGIKGNNWVSSFYENEPPGTGATGTLTSPSFKITDRYLTFLLSGGSDFNKLYAELQVKKEDWQAVWGVGKRAPWGETEDGFIKVSRITPAINSDEFFRYFFDLDTELNQYYIGKVVRIRIVDEKAGNWGYINADDFVFKSSLSEFISTMRNGFSILADKDKPVWGFADTHAHWINHVGLKNFMWGTPGGKLETSDVRRDVPPCDGHNHGLPTVTPGLFLAIVENKAMNRLGERLADPGNAACLTLSLPCLPSAAVGAGTAATFGSIGQGASGAYAKTGALDGTIAGALYGMATCLPFQACGHAFVKDVFAKHYGNNIPADRPAVSNYVDFPAWNSFAHQTMHVSWVRRSYDGGQRLMVVPVGVAKSWEFNTTTDGVMKPALEYIRNAIAALKELVSLNNKWIQIAYSAREAREIILQNKMAVIISLEQAEIGSYYATPVQEVNELYNLGIRHFFPIHNINNTLGATAVFNSALNSYNDLVNRSQNNGLHTCFDVREGNVNDETRVTVKLERKFMRQEIRFLPIAGFGNIPFFYMNDVPDEHGYEYYTAHKNRHGLRPKGITYLKELMKKGVLIDIDHMGDSSQNMTVRELNRYNYPFMSGHTNFRDLRRENNETDGDTKEARLKTEFTIYNTRATEIINSGGMFGIMNQPNNIQNASGCPVPNTSAGGSSSFIQPYWYALQKGGENHGIAFGSDANGFAPQVAPRFGTDAVYFLEGDKKLNHHWGDAEHERQRRTYAFLQKKGVRYDKPVSTYHYHRFQPTGFLTQEERDIWEALAMAKSGVDLMDAWQPGGGLSAERTGPQQHKIRNIANGFRWAQERRPEGDYGNFLQCHDILDGFRGECPNERWAAYMCVHGENSIPQHLKHSRTMDLYYTMKTIYDLWMQFENGPNEPLRRSYAGTRDFDFNLDGQAHYGMLPDLIQDMKNQGLTPNQLRPIFIGAEQFIKMWEKAEVARNYIRD
jgi:microsomal dipeptidase-like Zn-dependent dipeptidase